MFPLNRNVAIPDYSTQLETSFWQSRSGTKIGIIDWIPSDTWKPVFLIPVYDPVGFLLVLLQYSQWLVNSWKLKWFCLNSFKPLSVFFSIFLHRLFTVVLFMTSFGGWQIHLWNKTLNYFYCFWKVRNVVYHKESDTTLCSWFLLTRIISYNIC